MSLRPETCGLPQGAGGPPPLRPTAGLYRQRSGVGVCKEAWPARGQRTVRAGPAARPGARQRAGLGIHRTGDQPDLRSGRHRPALSRPLRLRERVRRVEEPVGLGRLHHAGHASQPGERARGGAGLQLVELVRAGSPPAGPARGADKSATAAGGRGACSGWRWRAPHSRRCMPGARCRSTAPPRPC